jgi:NTE family protein
MTPEDFAQIPFLRDAGPAAIRDVAKQATWYSLPGGWPLFEEGEPADTLWFVRTGSLGAFRRTASGATEFVGHIRQGEPVGEMALVAGEPHTASVHALRDTELFALDKGTFNRLTRRHPELMRNLARTMLFRMRQNRRRNPRADPRVFALLSASPTIDIEARARALKEALAKLGKRAVLVGEEAVERDSGWFDDIERWNDIVLLLGEIGAEAWTRLCLRQADRILVFGRADARPSAPLLPDDASPARAFQLVDVVLARVGGARPISQASEWLAAAGASRLFQWRDGVPDDVASLARVLAGASVGLVLGGGGARAYAHIGAVRALREAGVAFDFVGGTSMGAVVGACVAMGWDDGEIERRIWDAFVRSNPLNDYVLPVVAMTSGRKVDQRLSKHFADMRIEDMARPFFAVSTNLSAASIKVHRNGLLREALRASIALPGILPPFVMGGQVLVDGAVLENFPIGAMQDLHRGPNVGVDVTRQFALDPAEYEKPESFLKWVTRHGLHAPPPIADILIRSATVAVDPLQPRERADLLIVPELSNVALRDWKAFDAAVEAGYVAAVRALQQAPDALRAVSALGDPQV